MNGTTYVVLVVLAVCVVGVVFAIFRTRSVLQRNRRRAASRQAAFKENTQALLAEVRQRKAQGLPYDDLVSGYLATTTPSPAKPREPLSADAPRLNQAGLPVDMQQFFAHTSAANPAVQPPAATALGVPDPSVGDEHGPVTPPVSGGQPQTKTPTGQEAHGSWLDMLTQQSLAGLSQASTEVDAIASSQRPDAEKAALIIQVLNSTLGALPLAHLTMVRDAGSSQPTTP